MKNIAWLVPSLIEGSGGHRTILQNALFLSEIGFKTTIYLENDSNIPRGVSGEVAIRELFGYTFTDVRVGWQQIEPASAVFATIWYSAKAVRDLTFDCLKFYFIQDWEACFNPIGDTYLFAEQSYRYGLIPITIGKWLSANLKLLFDINARHFDFCADSTVYRPIQHIQKDKSIAFIYQPEKPRRCHQLGIEALGIVKHHMPDVQIILYGSRQTSHIWFDHVNLGLLPLEECNALYNRATLGVCISASNPSRIPFEMMAAGLPVVEVYRDNTLYDLPESSCLLCDPTPESIASGIIRLLNDSARLSLMSSEAAKFMSGKNLEYGYKQFAAAFEEALNINGRPYEDKVYHPIYSLPPVVADQFVNTISSELKRRIPAKKPTHLALIKHVGKYIKKFFRHILGRR
jgi:hypothetical protein